MRRVIQARCLLRCCLLRRRLFGCSILRCCLCWSCVIGSRLRCYQSCALCLRLYAELCVNDPHSVAACLAISMKMVGNLKGFDGIVRHLPKMLIVVDERLAVRPGVAQLPQLRLKVVDSIALVANTQRWPVSRRSVRLSMVAVCLLLCCTG